MALGFFVGSMLWPALVLAATFWRPRGKAGPSRRFALAGIAVAIVAAAYPVTYIVREPALSLHLLAIWTTLQLAWWAWRHFTAQPKSGWLRLWAVISGFLTLFAATGSLNSAGVRTAIAIEIITLAIGVSIWWVARGFSKPAR